MIKLEREILGAWYYASYSFIQFSGIFTLQLHDLVLVAASLQEQITKESQVCMGQRNCYLSSLLRTSLYWIGNIGLLTCYFCN